MNDLKYKQYRLFLKELPRHNRFAYTHLFIFFALTSLGIVCSLSNSIIIYFFGQAMLILSFLNGQVLLHDLGHGHFFTNKKWNHLLGHLVSLSPIIPYRPWVLIHAQHHRYAGNKFKDPTMVDKTYNDLKPSQIKFINWCWRYWIPIFALSYSFGSFWNIKKLFRLFPDQKKSILISILSPIIVYSLLILWGGKDFFIIWAPAYLLFLMLSEPMLLSQHVHIDQGDKRDSHFHPETQYHVKDQDIFSRSLIFPNWFSRWILIGFNEHAKHHLFPNLPGYQFRYINEDFPNTVSWLKWYRFCKSIDGATLLFKTNAETNLIEDHS
jgi:acyl-lipid omega-6 desaturase (Delta-12 desaturase)